jgi:hypothetical protein
MVFPKLHAYKPNNQCLGVAALAAIASRRLCVGIVELRRDDFQ